MEKYIIDKSIKRSQLGGVSNFFKTKFLNYKNNLFNFEVTFPKKSLNPFQTVQGGMIASALDEATAISVSMFTEDKKLPNSSDLHITFHRPVKIGKANVTAKIIKIGKRMVSIEGKLYNPNGEIAASVLHSAILVDMN